MSSQRAPGSSKKGKGSYYLVFCDSCHLAYFRHANVDYVTVMSTRHNLETKKIASYDIMCQYWINFLSRLLEFPLNGAELLYYMIIAWLVPKFHLAAHRQECRASFSLNYEPGAGRRDMEGPERTWFGLQGGGSTKDQGPGYWSDAMDDKFGHWNWSKLIRLGMHVCSLPPTISDVGVGPLLAKKYLNAVEQAKLHEEELALISEDLPIALVHSWTAMITTWENDRNSPNPYYMPMKSMSVSISNAVCLTFQLQKPPRLRYGNASHSKRRRSRQGWVQVPLTILHAQDFFWTDWMSNIASMFSSFSIILRWLIYLQTEVTCGHRTTQSIRAPGWCHRAAHNRAASASEVPQPSSRLPTGVGRCRPTQ